MKEGLVLGPNAPAIIAITMSRASEAIVMTKKMQQLWPEMHLLSERRVKSNLSFLRLDFSL